MKFTSVVFIIFLLVSTASAEIHTETIEYHHGDIILEGFLAYDDAISGRRPGVLVIHEWTGINDYTESRVRRLAELGYIAFEGDMYGKGIRPQTSEDAARQATIYRSDRALMRDRANAGLDWLKNHELTDPKRVAAIGYCFGGGTVLELARSGAELGGVVSFHGNLDTPDPADAKQMKAKVLILHGADDPHVPDEQVTAFFNEMSDAGVDWQMVFYGGAVHSFTNPGSGDDPSRGVAYNKAADRRSWEAMKAFFAELFE